MKTHNLLLPFTAVILCLAIHLPHAFCLPEIIVAEGVSDATVQSFWDCYDAWPEQVRTMLDTVPVSVYIHPDASQTGAEYAGLTYTYDDHYDIYLNASNPDWVAWSAGHEMGHVIDNQLGRIYQDGWWFEPHTEVSVLKSYGPDFLALYEANKSASWMWDYMKTAPEECFAHLCKLYMETPDELKQDSPVSLLEVAMKILVFSDSHGDRQTMVLAAEAHRPDAIFHLGDCWRDAEELEYAFPDTPLFRSKAPLKTAFS